MSQKPSRIKLSVFVDFNGQLQISCKCAYSKNDQFHETYFGHEIMNNVVPYIFDILANFQQKGRSARGSRDWEKI